MGSSRINKTALTGEGSRRRRKRRRRQQERQLLTPTDAARFGGRFNTITGEQKKISSTRILEFNKLVSKR